jgi:RNA polymerase sigma-70 factor, ECF subfamily
VTKPGAITAEQDVNSPEGVTSKAADASVERAYDNALLARAAAGDQQAFRELVERHQRKAHAVAFGLVRNPEDAREVVQEAFLRVYRHLNEFAGQASFGTWLYRIVVNLAIDTLRKRAPGQRIELEDHTDLEGAPAELIPSRGAYDPHETLGRKRLVEAMQSALDRLPPYHRAVILLRELEGMSYEEMAQALNVSKGTIMSRLFHARKKMQAMLRESLGADAVPQVEASDDEDDAAAPAAGGLNPEE